MPELPEVQTTLSAIEPYVKGQVLTQMRIRRRDLRVAVSEQLPESVVGCTTLEVQRRGKYLVFVFSHGVMLIHLGMSGSLRWVVDEPWRVHDHIEISWSDRVCRFCDPRRFGLVLWYGTHNHQDIPQLACLGPEPLDESCDGDWLYEATRQARVSIKSWLMNHHRIVGVGNIYANEALFMSGISPMRPACELSKVEARLLMSKIKVVLHDAIRAGGTTLRDFHSGHDKPGYFRIELQVYGRANEPCNVCGCPLASCRAHGRITVYCPQCQN